MVYEYQIVIARNGATKQSFSDLRLPRPGRTGARNDETNPNIHIPRTAAITLILTSIDLGLQSSRCLIR